MEVKEIHPQLSAEEREKRIGCITDELLKIAAKLREKREKSAKAGGV